MKVFLSAGREGQKLMKKLLRKVVRWYGCRVPWHRGKGRLIYFVGPRLINEGEVETITTPCGLQMSLELDEYVEQRIYYWGWYELYLARWVETHLEPSMVFFDLGAHVGQYTLLAAYKVGRSGQVHAFEPLKANFQSLVKNVQLNGLQNATLNNVAVSDYNGSAALYVEQGKNRGNVSIAEKTAGHRRLDTCKVIRLDDYFADLKLERVDMIKMNIEGAEWKALMGATEIVRHYRPTLILEVGSDCYAFGYTRAEMVRWLEGFGYRFFLLDQIWTGHLQKLDDLGSFKESWEMLLCIQK